MTIKHISFDVWNTLITANPQYTTARNTLIAEYAFTSIENAGRIYTKVKKQLDSDAERGVCGSSAQAWLRLNMELGLPGVSLSRLQKDCFEEFEKHPPILDRNLFAALGELNVSFDLSIKSNTNFIPGSLLLKASGLSEAPFMFAHFSDHYSMCKPDTRFFQLSLDEHSMYEVGAHEIVHVGDNLVCDGGCVKVGMKFKHVSSPKDLLDKIKTGEIINA